MKSRALGIGLSVLLGVVCTTAAAAAQESSLADAKLRATGKGASAESAMAYGRALRRAGHEAEALTELRRALGLAGARGDLAAQIDWEIARTHIAKRDFTSAMATCRTMLPLATAASHVCAAEAHLLWRRGTEAADEVAAARRSKDLPADVRYAALLVDGRIAELGSKDTDALTAYGAAIALAPGRPDAHLKLGVLLRRLGKDALPSLRKAVELDAHDATAQLELGRTLPAGSNESIAALERAVAERPSSTDALRALSEGYVAAKRLPDAKRTAEAVLKIAPNDFFSHVVAGRVALAEGHADKAIEEGETAGKLMPNAAAPKLLIADAWAHKGEIDLAVESYQNAFGLDHTDPAPLVNAARACLAAGRNTSARAFARRATQEFPELAAAWETLGDALAADKDRAAALTAYDAAGKLHGADAKGLEAKRAKLH
jgi:tetratricopeptide (TPR) repeat protein